VGAKFIDWVETRIIRDSLHGNPPVYDTALFPWARGIEQEWTKIRTELNEVLKRRDELPAFHELTKEVATITTDQNWKTFLFYGYGVKSEANVRACPETARLLLKIPGLKTAFFSILSPGKYIPPHRGPYNGVLRYHLGLMVPEPRANVRIRVDQQIRHWTEGKTLIFDDSFNHEVWNDTNGTRVVLFVDFVRPCRFPAGFINWLVLSLSVFTPFIREATDNQKNWEKKFYVRR
jgi:beta-hydroxylase